MRNVIRNLKPDDQLYSEMCKLSKNDFDNLVAVAVNEVDSSNIIKEVIQVFFF